jgi:hypothetical protein
LREYKFLFGKQEEHGRSAHAHMTSKPNDSDTGELEKHRDDKWHNE